MDTLTKVKYIIIGLILVSLGLGINESRADDLICQSFKEVNGTLIKYNGNQIGLATFKTSYGKEILFSFVTCQVVREKSIDTE